MDLSLDIEIFKKLLITTHLFVTLFENLFSFPSAVFRCIEATYLGSELFDSNERKWVIQILDVSLTQVF